MDATLAVSQVSPREKTGSSRLGMLLFVLLLALPMRAHAQFFCSWFPFLCPKACSQPLAEVTEFGSNPGNLKMCTYLPPNLGASRPLVVALHGCSQQASDYDDETGWIKFADKHRFALLLPQQQQANNSRQCFNWFEAGDNERGKGEALSIRNMIGKIVASAVIDPEKVYVTGLSAGGGMTAVMLATYPEVFAGGAIIAGIPYKCANNVSEALDQCGVSLTGQVAPMKDLTPAAWGNLVRSASNHNGRLPSISIWQGTSDTTVNPVDQRELVDQWTNVLGIDQTPDGQDTIHGHEHKLYKNSTGKVLVESVLVNGMGHGTPIAPGNAENQCGKVASFIRDAGICSSFYITKFWGIDSP
ncbi:alpha/beta hydrolase family esterase [Cupriavidus sp. NPDC089707]|uniref:extracellular catalytic domain type 1 short-chain-length polyhydroxyalkanoate depolymerase n=1 Tax=Cupriavidus sp. NPDC089707 TaxID=3363963 RepID=UPI0038071587